MPLFRFFSITSLGSASSKTFSQDWCHHGYRLRLPQCKRSSLNHELLHCDCSNIVLSQELRSSCLGQLCHATHRQLPELRGKSHSLIQFADFPWSSVLSDQAKTIHLIWTPHFFDLGSHQTPSSVRQPARLTSPLVTSHDVASRTMMISMSGLNLTNSHIIVLSNGSSSWLILRDFQKAMYVQIVASRDSQYGHDGCRFVVIRLCLWENDIGQCPFGAVDAHDANAAQRKMGHHQNGWFRSPPPAGSIMRNCCSCFLFGALAEGKVVDFKSHDGYLWNETEQDERHQKAEYENSDDCADSAQRIWQRLKHKTFGTRLVVVHILICPVHE